MTKTKLFLIPVLFALITLSLSAQQGGFRGPSVGPITVAEALNLRDDAPVILRGRVLRFLGNERYLFADDTGTITVEIKRRIWGTLSIDENDIVEISGEIERNRNRVEVEVDSIRKI
ncbi:MAG: NirD/YgiW/YdeI family stress tolerance protein [Treponema sp.]|nr:NirD/YgiW/YdeI family stress tolerance protein [Treponema sp.]